MKVVTAQRSGRVAAFSMRHAEGHGDRLFEATYKLGLEGIVSKKLNAPYRSGRQEPGSK
jgi:bifunctional non-homologous end joining protein LigD